MNTPAQVTAGPDSAEVVSLKGRTIVVTGAGQGIGRATTELVVKLGGNVVVMLYLGGVLHALQSQFLFQEVIAELLPFY